MNKIKVTFINLSDNKIIATSEMLPEQLPDTFEIATTLHIGENDWQIKEAIPANSAEFIKSKLLTLKMVKIEKIDPKDILFSLPTISNEIASITNFSIFNDFEYRILEDEWRNKEFLNSSLLESINRNIDSIKKIWKNDAIEGVQAFKKCHVRDVGLPNLSINFEELKKLLDIKEVGSLKFNNNFIEDGFSIKTKNSIYYGILKNNIITQFVISEFSDNSIDEIFKIITKFKILFVDWYNYNLISI